jgi:hypothetical protein
LSRNGRYPAIPFRNAYVTLRQVPFPSLGPAMWLAQGGAAPPAFSNCTFANEYEWSVWRLSQSQLILDYFSTSGCSAQAIKLFVFPLHRFNLPILPQYSFYTLSRDFNSKVKVYTKMPNEIAFEPLNLLDDLPTSAQPGPVTKTSRRARNDQKWNSLKDVIYRIYTIDNFTLQNTKRVIEDKHGFKAR